MCVELRSPDTPHSRGRKCGYRPHVKEQRLQWGVGERIQAKLLCLLPFRSLQTPGGNPSAGVNTSLTRMHSSCMIFVFPFLTYSVLDDSLWVHLRLYKMTQFRSFLGQE